MALKVLRNRFSEKPVQASLFVREGRLGCALRHPNIVPIYEVFSKGRMHFLVMEFIEGRNLREFVRIRKKLDPLEATRLMISITDGLRYAFEHGLTHRDLKMSNVLVSSRGEAKLVDFGLASMDDTLSDDALADLPNTRTVDYAALERATGVRKDDVRSDIYFLGCIYYNMLTGQPPLVETRDRVLRLSKQRFLDVVPIQKVDRSLPVSVSVVVNKAMALDPERRYQSPLAMLVDLRTVVEAACRGGFRRGRGRRGGRFRRAKRLLDRLRRRQHRTIRHGRRVRREDAGHLPQELQTGRIPRAGDGRSGQGHRPVPARRLGGRLHRVQRPADRTAPPWRCSTSWARTSGPSRSRPSCCWTRSSGSGSPRPAPPGTASC